MRIFLIGVAAAALGVTAAQAATPAPAKFVEEAGASDRFEIDSAKLMTTAKNAKVAAFARRMLVDHAKSTAAIKAAAKADGLTPKPPELTIGQRADLTALKVAPAGKTKDDLYIKQQRAAHDQALALMQDYAANGTASHLKTAAGKIAPVVEHHIASLNAM